MRNKKNNKKKLLSFTPMTLHHCRGYIIAILATLIGELTHDNKHYVNLFGGFT